MAIDDFFHFQIVCVLIGLNDKVVHDLRGIEREKGMDDEVDSLCKDCEKKHRSKVSRKKEVEEHEE